MWLNEQWLRKWVNPPININQICEQITQSGLEVEEIKNMFCDIQDVIIGEIISYFNHPINNNLKIIKVNINTKKLITIISSIKYCKIHMKVVVACIGSTISNNIIIQAFRIDNILSEGILCSFHDLNMFGNNEEIIELPDSAPIGIKLKNYPFYIDKIIKINITPNRMDALGILGISRDVSILNNLPLPIVKNKIINFDIINKCQIKSNISDLVFNYQGRLIKNINLKILTPLWMKEKLRRCHIHSINIVVDIINYVFLELGQSVYVFSFLKIINEIFLRFSKLSERININNQKDIILNNKMVVISDKDNILSFLGNINFNFFPINLNYTNLFIGSFFIDPNILAYLNYDIKLYNPDIVFNEYYVDPGLQYETIEYITNLFLSICGGYAGPITKYDSKKININKKIIYLYYKNIKKILGYEININSVWNILKKLGYQIVKSENCCLVTPPTWKLDIKIEEDIISDIMRIYKYNDIFSKPLYSSQRIIPINKTYNFLKRVKFLLIDKGYHEIINYSFIDPNIQNLIYPKKKTLILKNPLSSDMSCMRISLWPGLIQKLVYHQNRQYEEIRLFESGLCFLPDFNHKLGVKQSLYFSGIIGGIKHKKYWDIPPRVLDFYDIKGDIESIFETIGYLEEIKFIKKDFYGLHPQQSISIFFRNKIIGIFGALHPKLLKKFSLHYTVFLFEIFWNQLSFQDILNIKKISEFPISKRDISIIVFEYICIEDMIIACKNKFFDYIIEIRVFDIYRGHPIPLDKKSVSFTLVFQSACHTLIEKEITDMVNSCINILKCQFQAVLRN